MTRFDQNLSLIRLTLAVAAMLASGSATVLACPEGHSCVSIGVSREITPEERRENEERDRRAQIERAAFTREVDLEVQRLGAHRRAEAERLVTLRRRAAAARDGSPISAATGPATAALRQGDEASNGTLSRQAQDQQLRQQTAEETADKAAWDRRQAEWKARIEACQRSGIKAGSCSGAAPQARGE